MLIKNLVQQHWKWFLPSIIVTLCLLMFFSSGMNKVTADLAIAYNDTELFKDALDQVKANKAAVTILGEIQPIDKLSILEGQVNYSKNNTVVKSSIRIIGSKGKAKLDIIANKINTKWVYQSISIRINQPKDQKQTIVILEE